MPFEVFDKRMTPLAKAPAVTIQKRGVISLNVSVNGSWRGSSGSAVSLVDT